MMASIRPSQNVSLIFPSCRPSPQLDVKILPGEPRAIVSERNNTSGHDKTRLTASTDDPSKPCHLALSHEFEPHTGGKVLLSEEVAHTKPD